MNCAPTTLPELAVLRLERTFDAPRALVWKAWTERDRLMEWWGPTGSQMTTANQDLRIAGMLHYRMETSDEQIVWGKCVYRVIDEPERLEFVASFSDPAGGTARHPRSQDWPLEFVVSATFKDLGRRTTVALEAWPINALEEEIVAFVAGHIGMEQGFGGSFDKLDKSLYGL